MFDAGDFFAILSLVGSRNLVPDQLFAGFRMLALGQPCKLFVMNRAMEVPLAGKRALPFTVALLIAAPVILLLRSKFFGVVVSIW
jgi:hypothetical protein